MVNELNNRSTTPSKGAKKAQKNITLAQDIPATPTPFASCPTPKLVQDILQAYGCAVRYNMLSRRVETTGAQDLERLAIRVRAYCQSDPYAERAKGLKITKETVYDTLAELALSKSYNPALELIDGLPSDNARDYLAELYTLLGIETNTVYQDIMRTWLCQAYALLHNSLADPIQPQGILVLQGAQGLGKTTLCRCMSLGQEHPELFRESAILDAQNKDTIDQTTRYWIAELGELDGITKKQDELLKGLITSPIDEYRGSYARESKRFPRLTSLCATVNSKEFLYDTTGGRRFWIIPLGEGAEETGSLSLCYEKIVSFPWLQLWAQVRDLARASYAATPADQRAGARWQGICVLQRATRAALALKYSDYFVTIPGEQELLNIVEAGTAWTPQLALQIQQNFPFLQKLNARVLGKALAKLAQDGAGNGTETVTASVGRGRRVYYNFPQRLIVDLSD